MVFITFMRGGWSTSTTAGSVSGRALGRWKYTAGVVWYCKEVKCVQSTRIQHPKWC